MRATMRNNRKPMLLFTTGHKGQVSALESMDRVVEGMPGEEDKVKAMEMGRKLAEAVKLG